MNNFSSEERKSFGKIQRFAKTFEKKFLQLMHQNAQFMQICIGISYISNQTAAISLQANLNL